MSYADLLKNSAEKAGNIACMGLDPVAEIFPGSGKDCIKRIVPFFEELFKGMKKRGLCPSAFKPNIGYYVKYDVPRKKQFAGSQALADVLDLINENFPGIPVILDSKRGDIATSSLNYAREAFDCWMSDAVTVSPYMGSDSVMPFAYENKGVYILCRTSNPGGKDLQNEVQKDGSALYEKTTGKIIQWSEEFSGFGAVAGATNPAELEKIASAFAQKKIPLLIPGVGSQGGSASEVMSILKKTGYPVYLARINSSSKLTHPWKKGDAPSDAVDVCLENISSFLSSCQI